MRAVLMYHSIDDSGSPISIAPAVFAEHVQWIRWRHKIPYPASYARDGELTVTQIAQRLGISDGTVYDWISTGKLTARRGPAKRFYIPYGPDVEQDCRQLVANSVHLPAETRIRAAGGAV